MWLSIVSCRLVEGEVEKEKTTTEMKWRGKVEVDLAMLVWSISLTKNSQDQLSRSILNDHVYGLRA